MQEAWGDNTNATAVTVIKDDTMKATFKAGKEVLFEVKFKVDESKSPKLIDVDDKGKKSLGIRKFDGSKLIIVLSLPGGKRPISFTTKKGEDFLIFALKK